MNVSSETTVFDVTSPLDVTTEAPDTTWSANTTMTGSVATAVMSTATDLTTNIAETTTHLFDTYGIFIHPHWKNFPIVSDEWHYLIGIIITCVGITGIIGNSLVIWMFSREKSLRTSSNMFIVNLAISDLTFSVVNGFPLFSISSFNKRWIFGTAACEFYGLIGGIFGLMSINTMVAIAIDRYYAIARPLHVAKFMTRKRAFLMIVTVWIWSFASATPPIFGWGRYIPEGFGTSCTYDYLTRTNNNITFIFFMYIFGFAVPLGVIILCYAMIIRAVKVHENEMKKTAKKLNAEMRSNQDKKNMEIRVAKIAMSILVLYLLSWLPYATVALIGMFGDASFVTPFWAEIPVLFAKASAMHNPLVYALSHPKFRAALQTHAPWLTCCCKPEAKPAMSTGTSFKDRNASKRSVTSVTGASVSSEMSNVSDSMYADMEFRLRKLEEEQAAKRDPKTVSKKKANKNQAVEQADDIPAGKIIQDLAHALVEATSREKTSHPVQPVYLPSSILKGKSSDSKEPSDGIFVLDSNTIPELAKYLTTFSNLNNENIEGVVNQGLELSPEVPPYESVGARPKTSNVEDNDGSGVGYDEAQL
ncbi:rhodopsin, GQ-coupled-like [Ruditapes philippinarum]|uniref:rhodopsin, GQ-coupled-like n=1 Tax=Ruditapes philippinarum TaxID=129788 RepID=UPI00295C11C8|nr:rhodopsin, GQ-coupled-like [Ruditapes philippinarum]